MIKDVAYNVLINLISTLVTSVILILLAFLYYQIRRASIMKDVRRLIPPPKRVIRCQKISGVFRVSDTTPFDNIYDDNEIRELLSFTGKKNAFNGECVRLDKINDDGSIELSIVGFFDFMTTNLLLLPSSNNLISVRQVLYSSDYRRRKELEFKIKDAVNKEELKSANGVLSQKHLANIVTVSILLKDSVNNVLLVKRGKDVAISSGKFAVAAAGSVAVEDLESDNPFLACAYRELKEELGITDVKLRITELVISKQKMQPAVLVYGEINDSFYDRAESMRNAPDFNSENQSLYVVSETAIRRVVRKLQFTDVAAYQLYTVAKDSGHFEIEEL